MAATIPKEIPTRVYEGLFLFDSNRYSRDPAGVPNAINDTIKEAGGEMLASRLWSEQKLAYPIDGHRKGTYWLTYFRLSTDKLVGINRQFKLNDNILRNLVLVVDDRLVEPLVEHAQGATKKEAAAEAPKTDGESKPKT